jgi:hypothetical protein
MCGAREETPICSSVTYEDGPYFFAREHATCGAQATVSGTLEPVAETLKPQGEAMRLFAPAPTQIQGQMTL